MTIVPSERRILVVDDERDFVETLEDILQSKGYQVAVACNPDEALRQIQARPPVALLDIRLGRSSGIDLLAALRAASPDLIAVMMTAYADVETAVQALANGAHYYLRKPIDPRDLLSTLDRCFERVRLEEEKAAAERALRARNEALAEINARLAQMVASARSLASCTRLEDLNRRLLEEFARVMAAEGGSLFFRKEGAFERVWSLDGDHVPTRIPLPLPAGSVFARVLEHRTPLVVRDISRAADLRGSGWAGYRDGSLLVLPIVVGEDVEGLLSLHNKKWPPFTEQDQELGLVMISLSAEILRAQQSAEAVRASEERYRLLAENVMDVILVADAGLKLRYVSPSVTHLTGFTVAEALSRGLEGMVPPPLVDRTLATLNGLLENGHGGQTARTLDLDLRRKDGTAVRAEMTVSAVRGPGGPGLLGVARDVTERRRAEAQLARLATAVEQAAESMVITDASGAIQYVNPSFERVTGYSREEVIGQNPRVLRSGVHPPAFYRDLWSMISAGGVWRGRITNRRKDGALIQEEGSITPIRDPEGRIIGYVSARYDVTKQAALEARLAQAQKMESIGRLAGGIAHDFNNILAAILGFVELLERASVQPEKLRRYVHGIGEAAWRAADLTKQILTFSRQGSPERRPLELGPVVREALTLMRAVLPSTIEIRERAGGEAVVVANATQLHQVVVNLCTNAGHAMGDGGGVLDVSVDEIDVDAAMTDVCPPLVPGRHVRLTVSDTGCGMTPEVVTRIFDPFFTTRGQGEGTGMGLPVVHGIVEDHGGTITVSSAPGAGSTFRVFLPALPAAPVPPPAPVLVAPGRERILFVDDEPIQVELGRQVLETLGYVVTAVGSAREALDLVRADPGAFDVVVTDTTMPGMPGDVLAREVLVLRPDLPIVLCTGFSERATEARMRELGVRELLTKPYSLSELSLAIRRALRTSGTGGGPREPA
jgi:PAS domain S-box-containing protein